MGGDGRQDEESITRSEGMWKKDRKNEWWDEECKERKREMRSELREWRRKGGRKGI